MQFSFVGKKSFHMCHYLLYGNTKAFKKNSDATYRMQDSEVASLIWGKYSRMDQVKFVEDNH